MLVIKGDPGYTKWPMKLEALSIILILAIMGAFDIRLMITHIGYIMIIYGQHAYNT